MIHPFKIWTLPTTTKPERATKQAAEEAHADLLVDLCTPLGVEIAQALPKTSKDGKEGRGTAYGRSLALILRHLPIESADDREWKDARRLILEAFDKMAMNGIDDLPPASNLVISADYGLAFPGGVYLRDLLGMTIFNQGAGLSLYEFQLAQWDLFWEDSWRRIAWDIKTSIPASELSAKDKVILADLKRPTNTTLANLRLVWLKQGSQAQWDLFVKWVGACRAAVVMPVQKERRW